MLLSLNRRLDFSRLCRPSHVESRMCKRSGKLLWRELGEVALRSAPLCSPVCVVSLVPSQPRLSEGVVRALRPLTAPEPPSRGSCSIATPRGCRLASTRSHRLVLATVMPPRLDSLRTSVSTESTALPLAGSPATLQDEVRRSSRGCLLPAALDYYDTGLAP